jgi:DNA invertase Pin-like site-specific DNA recombinase
MRAVIYAWYSSDLQRDASIEDQTRVCRRRIDAEGWKLGQVYSDHSASGASHLRAGYQTLLADARKQMFDVVVAESLDACRAIRSAWRRFTSNSLSTALRSSPLAKAKSPNFTSGSKAP